LHTTKIEKISKKSRKKRSKALGQEHGIYFLLCIHLVTAKVATVVFPPATSRPPPLDPTKD
jgi:hypothetical protein